MKSTYEFCDGSTDGASTMTPKVAPGKRRTPTRHHRRASSSISMGSLRSSNYHYRRQTSGGSESHGSNNSSNSKNQHGTNEESNGSIDGTGSLAYSETSSVYSHTAESTSDSSSFADIMRVLDGNDSREFAGYLKDQASKQHPTVPTLSPPPPPQSYKASYLHSSEHSAAGSGSLAYSTDAESQWLSFAGDSTTLQGVDLLGTTTCEPSETIPITSRSQMDMLIARRNSIEGNPMLGRNSPEKHDYFDDKITHNSVGATSSFPGSVPSEASHDPGIYFSPAEYSDSLKRRKEKKRHARRQLLLEANNHRGLTSIPPQERPSHDTNGNDEKSTAPGVSSGVDNHDSSHLKRPSSSLDESRSSHSSTSDKTLPWSSPPADLGVPLTSRHSGTTSPHTVATPRQRLPQCDHLSASRPPSPASGESASLIDTRKTPPLSPHRKHNISQPEEKAPTDDAKYVWYGKWWMMCFGDTTLSELCPAR